MANTAQGRLIRALSPGLADHAVDLTERAGSSEFAFPVACGEDVLESLLQADVLPLGGDLWKLDEGEFYATGDSWYMNSIVGEYHADRVARIKVAARHFLDLYRAAENGWVTFVV
jgi:hypothetical protein